MRARGCLHLRTRIRASQIRFLRGIGQPVDVGGRTLKGSATVILQSGRGGSGMGWKAFKRGSDLRQGVLVRSRGLRLEQSGTLPASVERNRGGLAGLLARAVACGAVMCWWGSLAGLAARVYVYHYPTGVTGMWIRRWLSPSQSRPRGG
jgi:hypothetical protein